MPFVEYQSSEMYVCHLIAVIISETIRLTEKYIRYKVRVLCVFTAFVWTVFHSDTYLAS
jgi:hypothetical protein